MLPASSTAYEIEKKVVCAKYCIGWSFRGDAAQDVKNAIDPPGPSRLLAGYGCELTDIIVKRKSFLS
jgi:hypothetical protein